MRNCKGGIYIYDIVKDVISKAGKTADDGVVKKICNSIAERFWNSEGVDPEVDGSCLIIRVGLYYTCIDIEDPKTLDVFDMADKVRIYTVKDKTPDNDVMIVVEFMYNNILT